MPTSVNITQGKTASASSYIMPYAPSRAVDGLKGDTNRWLCATSRNSWLRVDLGGYYRVTGWGVTSIGAAGWNPTCNLNSFQLQVSATPLPTPSWFIVDSVLGNTANAVNRTLTYQPVANSVMVYITQGDSRPQSTLASILEFYAMGYPVSNNANLSNLTMSSGTLTPAFSSSVLGYTSTVPNSVSSITVTPTAQDAEATISVNNLTVKSGVASQSLNLNVGANTITVAVKSPDTTTAKTYIITVTRQAPLSTNANLSNLTISNGTLTPAFVTGTTSYTAAVGYDVSSIAVTPTAQDASATIAVNNTAVASGMTSGPINLNVGPNTITVVVTSAAGNTQTYTVTVTRSSPYLTGLSLSSISIPFSKNTYAYTASVDNSVNSITATPIAEDATAVITVNNVVVTSGNASQAISLNEGSNTITVTVTPSIGTPQSYTITVTRAASVCLTGLTVVAKPTAGGTLTPSFTSGNTAYSITVPSNTTGLTITATAPNNSYTITVNNLPATSGVAKSIGYSASVNVKVTYNGTTIIYTVAVSK